MTTPNRMTVSLALGAVTGVLLLAGCSSDAPDDDPGSPDPDRGIDASHYAEQYDEAAQDQASCWLGERQWAGR